MKQKDFMSEPPRMRIGCATMAIWALGGLFCAYAGLFFVLTMLLPGPIEPPSNMNEEEFWRQVDSGEWFRGDMKTCAVSGGIGVLLIEGLRGQTEKRENER